MRGDDDAELEAALGQEREGAAGEMEDPDHVDRRGPLVDWYRVSAVGAFVYLTAWAASVALLPFAHSTFNRLHRLAGNVTARAVLCALVLCVVFHALDGLRRVLADLLPATARHERGARTAVVFSTWAVIIPCWAVIMMPSASGRFG